MKGLPKTLFASGCMADNFPFYDRLEPEAIRRRQGGDSPIPDLTNPNL
jgi:hypothetical protein